MTDLTSTASTTEERLNWKVKSLSPKYSFSFFPIHSPVPVCQPWHTTYTPLALEKKDKNRTSSCLPGREKAVSFICRWVINRQTLSLSLYSRQMKFRTRIKATKAGSSNSVFMRRESIWLMHMCVYLCDATWTLRVCASGPSGLHGHCGAQRWWCLKHIQLFWVCLYV